MVETSGLTFAPTLHQITAERVAFIYNTNKSGSQSVAEYYRDKREIPNENLIGLPITLPVTGGDGSGLSCETVISKEAFVDEIETPLITALNSIGTDFTSDNARSIWVLILGFGIPIAYSEDGETIAIASRLHLLGQNISPDNSPKQSNHTYDRRGSFKFFDDLDANLVFITAVLDGPTEASVKTMIDRALDVDNQTFITGKVYVDPYGQKISAEQLQYQADIIDFVDNELPNLGLNSVITTDIDDPYQEPTVLSFANESFYWGWFNPTYAKQLFTNQNERRVFLYNADDRAACNIHFYRSSTNSPFDLNGSDHWCNLAINIASGYAACAGSVSDPGEEAFLRPRPFFETLHQGATIGEAFLFASKFINWKTVLIGDPLTVVNFPVDLPKSQDINFTLIDNNEVIRRTKVNIEESIGWGIRQAGVLEGIRDKVVSSTDITESVRLLEPTFLWLKNKDTISQQNVFLDIVSAWMRYIQQTTGLSLLDWLTNNKEKISTDLRNIVSQTAVEEVADSLTYPGGFWECIFQYDHPILSLDDVFFTLEVSTGSGFSFNDLVFLTLNSSTSVNGWEYESEPDIFIPMPDDGFPSNFSGRRIRFSSPSANFLDKTEVYFVKWKAIGINKEDTRRIIIYT